MLVPAPFVSDAAHWLSEGRKLKSEARFIESAQAFARAAALAPDGRGQLHQGLALRDAGQVDTALTVLAAYCQSHPNDPDGWSMLGTLFKREGRWAEAVPPLRQSVALREDAPTRNALVTSLWRCGAMAEAQIEGLRNLQQKDRRAMESFATTPWAGQTLRPWGRSFDPDRRSRNIIAFSLWGDRPEYVTGAIINAQIAPHLYVGWTARFYCDTSVPADAREALSAHGAQVILMDRPDDARLRPMWRFLASDDPGVNVFLCRDADSRLNAKELLAVQDWLFSRKRFHVMRDHLYHMELMLAGMWGGVAGVLPDIRTTLAAAPRYFDNRFADQAFLADMVWPLIRPDACIHDTHYRFPDAGPFPPGYDLPGQIHVGGGVKSMPHWSRYVGRRDS
ncbi:tetratricopeptide repeat protein [Gemmobacter denitrificans]|uniref:Tetratricopeptide repeat protein n=1 Tax=Gemmobacter denitrificans TaxID=3123040 RepID=A0ABU8BTE0_9RHOB